MIEKLLPVISWSAAVNKLSAVYMERMPSIAPVFPLLLSNGTPKTNAFSIIGKKALVIKNIDSINKSGQIKVNGEVWSAIGKNDDTIEKGTEVEVVSINGVKAVVKPSSHS